MINKSIFVDTNILVYFKVEESAFFEKTCKQLIDLHDSNKLFISNQILREYWSTMTKLPNSTNINKVNIINEDIKYFKKIFSVLEDLQTTSDKLFTIAELYKVRGKQIHDANIVATMLENNIKDLFTHNVKDFERYKELINIIPLE